MPSEKLMPCPFCGGSIELRQMGDDKFVAILCETCQASGPNHYGQYEWNSRLTAAEQAEPNPAALEPAEPAADAEPVATVYRKGNATGQLVWTKAGDHADLPDGTKLFTRPPESRLREALEWYAEQARLCRLIHSGGDAGRNALAKDGGAKARAALAQEDGR